MGVRFERGTGVEYIRVGERMRVSRSDIIFSLVILFCLEFLHGMTRICFSEAFKTICQS